MIFFICEDDLELKNCICLGETESPFFTLEESITMVKITDEVRRQIGLFYQADKQTSAPNL